MSDLGNKEIFSRNLKKYIEQSGKTRKQICSDLDLTYSTFTEWVNGNIYPRIDKIELLSNYFGIEKSDLIEDNNDRDNAYYQDADTRDFVQFMYENPEYKVLFDATKNVKKEDIEFVADMINRLK